MAMTEPVVIGNATLSAPFPWFGGKSRIAPAIWERLGDVQNYVEPFFGSGAALLNRPTPFTGPETVNDADGFVANAWRAIARDPEATAHHADWPVNECDLHARHLWLVAQRGELTERLMGDPDYFDAKIAGWWIWGICSWIGSGWCSGKGPWQAIDGKLTDTRKLPHLGNAGMGINRQLPHLGAGRGINRKLPHLGAGRGIRAWFEVLAERLRGVRIACGDWSRVMGDSVTVKHGVTGVLLDPPYADTAGRVDDLYAVDCNRVAHNVRAWAIANGDNASLRIALCGYEGEHDMPKNWTVLRWKASGGYGSQGNTVGRANAARECVWFSPACLEAAQRQASLFDPEPIQAPEQSTIDFKAPVAGGDAL
jgi:DNA adenine methylase